MSVAPEKPSPDPTEYRSCARSVAVGGSGIPCVRSEQLFTQGREILIEHAGCYYRLRMTHSNKLILTK